MPTERSWFGTPIFILNFNQLSYLRKQIAWLLQAGYRNVTVLDNHSTYPPLLRYYDAMTSGAYVAVVRRAANDRKVAVWNEHLLALEGPFVLTSSDVVPDACCPADVVAHLASHLRENPQLFKAGLGLRLDDVPARYKHRREVLVKQSEYWRVPAARGLFLAPIDFTFALYRRGSPFEAGPAVRTSWPYLARHEPWYSDSADRTEEERYYAATIAPGRGSWGRERLPDWLVETCARMAAEPPRTLLHLACGRDLFPGWINVDVQPDVGADITFDLERRADERLPIDDDSVDGFFMARAFGRIERIAAMFQELYRVARAGARFVIRIRQPRDASDRSTERFRPDRFGAWPVGAVPGPIADWKVERIKLVVDPEADGVTAAEAAARMGAGADVVREIVVHLRAMKPSGAGDRRWLAAPTVDVSASPIDEGSAF